MSAVVEIVARCAPWSGQRASLHSVRVDIGEHPRVRVWDPIGKIFTVCHALTPRTEARIVTAARASQVSS